MGAKEARTPSLSQVESKIERLHESLPPEGRVFLRELLLEALAKGRDEKEDIDYRRGSRLPSVAVTARADCKGRVMRQLRLAAEEEKEGEEK